jgi:hypothetical protein
MWFNPIMTWLLNSRFHKMVSGSTLILTIKGRKSGRMIEVPVNYIRDGRTLHDREVMHALGEYFKLAPQMAKYFKVKIDREGNPDLSDLGAAARSRVVIKITLI